MGDPVIRSTTSFTPAALLLAVGAHAQIQKEDYQLGADDVIKITVFQNPDLATR